MPQRQHLRRLDNVWVENPLYFLTICCARRQPAAALISAWQNPLRLYGWAVGRYVIMPDHVHFFARSMPDAKPLSHFMRNWKRWTANQIISQTSLPPPLWQSEFFDHVIRSADSYSEKWDYVRANPVRAGLVATPDAWPHTGEITSLRF